MNSLYPPGGYTIIETMIFLVISVALFGTVVTTMTQQTNRNRFAQAVETFERDMRDLLNDVSTGTYPSTGAVSCTSGTGPGGRPGFNPGIVEQGSNTGCIFIGKVVQFSPKNNEGQFNIYTMVGNRTANAAPDGPIVQNLTEAKYDFLGVPPPPPTYGVQENVRLNSGLIVTKVVDLADPTTEMGGIAIVSDFGKLASINQAVAGNASRVTLRGVEVTFGLPPNAFASPGNAGDPDRLPVVSPAGLLICLRDGNNANGRRATITIGGNNQNLSVRRVIDPPAGGDCL